MMWWSGVQESPAELLTNTNFKYRGIILYLEFPHKSRQSKLQNQNHTESIYNKMISVQTLLYPQVGTNDQEPQELVYYWHEVWWKQSDVWQIWRGENTKWPKDSPWNMWQANSRTTAKTEGFSPTVAGDWTQGVHSKIVWGTEAVCPLWALKLTH